jgi:hypothetical protein
MGQPGDIGDGDRPDARVIRVGRSLARRGRRPPFRRRTPFTFLSAVMGQGGIALFSRGFFHHAIRCPLWYKARRGMTSKYQ